MPSLSPASVPSGPLAGFFIRLARSASDQTCRYRCTGTSPSSAMAAHLIRNDMGGRVENQH